MVRHVEPGGNIAISRGQMTTFAGPAVLEMLGKKFHAKALQKGLVQGEQEIRQAGCHAWPSGVQVLIQRPRRKNGEKNSVADFTPHLTPLPEAKSIDDCVYIQYPYCQEVER